MRARDFLDAAERLPMVGTDALLGEGGAVIVAPHPDDESLGCSALIATAVAEGRDVKVVIVSDGVGSHPSSKTYPPARLRELREGEARQAVAELGLDDRNLTFLRLPDRYVPNQGAEADAAAEAIARLCREARATALFVTWREDPHCDHKAAYAIARAAQRRSEGVRLYEYSVWGRALPPDTEVSQPLAGSRFDAAEMRFRKRAAIGRHLSQVGDLIDDDPDGFRLSEADRTRLELGDEIFLEAEA